MSESQQESMVPAPEPTETGQDDQSAPENAGRRSEAAASDTEVLGSAEPESGAQRDPEQWVTGDQPATGPQKSYLDSLARQAGEEISADLTKAEASENIDRLQQKLDVQPNS